jgi:hypothetical protein
MEAMLVSLGMAIFISTSKNVMSFLLSLMSSLQQNWRRGQKRLCLEVRGWGRKREEGRGEKWPKHVYTYE